MKYKYKLLNQDEYRQVTITRWGKMKQYDIELCDIKGNHMQLVLHLFIGSDKEMIRYARDEYNTPLEQTDDTIANYIKLYHPETKVPNHYIHLKSLPEWFFQDYNTIAHEVHHFTHLALKENGIDYGEGGEELFAYTQGYFTEMVIRALKRLKQIKRNAKSVRSKPKKKHK